MFWNCIPHSWMLFQDPDNDDQDKQLQLLIERVDALANAPPHATTEERNHGRLLWYLIKAKGNLEDAYVLWLNWVEWKRGLQAQFDQVSDAELQAEIDAKVAHWKGKDRWGRHCVVITGRNHDTMGRQGNFRSFQKFMFHVVEEGCKLADADLLANHVEESKRKKEKKSKGDNSAATVIDKSSSNGSGSERSGGSSSSSSAGADPTATKNISAATTTTPATAVPTPVSPSRRVFVPPVPAPGGRMYGLLDPISAEEKAARIATKAARGATPSPPPVPSASVSIVTAPAAPEGSAAVDEAVTKESGTSAPAPTEIRTPAAVTQDEKRDALGRICILYDRRGMGDRNIDPVLFQLCRQLFNDLQDHYGDRLGVLYVLGINWFFLMLYQYVLQPFLAGIGRKIIKVIENEEDLVIDSFERSEIHLHDFDEAARAAAEAAATGDNPSGPNSTEMMSNFQQQSAAPAATTPRVEAPATNDSIDR